MQVFPAIDLLGGKVVRLREGRRDAVTVYREDPMAMLLELAAAGPERIHVVDLDGAFQGGTAQGELIAELCRRSPVPLQVGGGLRDLAAIERAAETGAAALVLGTAAVKDPALVAAACARFPGRIVVAVDARDGKVAVEGWTEVTARDAVELARACERDGAAAILYTDIARDGTQHGPNVERTAALQRVLAVPVIASGGIGRLSDVAALRDAGVRACVVGRALYEGAFTVAEALATGAGR